jgi:VIT1/CCC1 family predicted Fe2+/Mn2+ transporter
MLTREDIGRYRENLNNEREAIHLYTCLADKEENPELATVYRKLAETEKKHASTWEELLQRAGEPVPDFRPGWRIRSLCWLAERFGTSFVLPTIVGLEQGAQSEYDSQPEPEAAEMSAHERSHARVFRYLSKTSKGLEGSVVARFEGRHRAAGGNALRAGVLGANDGLVSVFSLVMGVAGAGMGSHQIFLTGMAGLLAGALSMALGEWLSVQSSRELYQRQIGIEKQELEENPEEEMEELALIYQAKGIPEKDARAMAQRLLSDRQTALDTLSREELGINPGELGGSAWEASLTSFFLFALGAVIPVIPYLFLTGTAGIMASAAASAAGLFAIGALITLMTGLNPVLSGLRQVAFGLVAAATTYGAGWLIGINLG